MTDASAVPLVPARLVRGARGGGKRGIEDLYWALLNSTEFLTNH